MGIRSPGIGSAPPDLPWLARLASALLVAVSITGCSGKTPGLDRMLGTAPPPTATPTPAKAAKANATRRVYYATADGTKVYAQPSSSTNVVGTLALDEKVLRSRVERGYALIESSTTGVKGWVDNARLTWKAPGARSSAAPAAPPAAEEPDAAAEEEEAAPPEPTPEPTPTIAAPPAASPPAPTKKPAREGVDPSIFNPY
jgi:hypothetical protein